MATPEHPWRHLMLLISILVLFIIGPFVLTFRHGVLILNVAGVAVLVAGTYALSERKHLFAIAILLSAISILGTCLLLVFPQRWAVLLSHSFILVLLAFFCITILAFVLNGSRVTSDKIFAAVCVYLLMGYAWSFAYAMLDELQPQSFAASTEVGFHDYPARILQFRYFSFMTLTTVGYGDIVPRSPAARTMTILEAVMGRFYLVALVGRLVGLHIVHGSDPRSRA